MTARDNNKLITFDKEPSVPHSNDDGLDFIRTSNLQSHQLDEQLRANETAANVAHFIQPKSLSTLANLQSLT